MGFKKYTMNKANSGERIPVELFKILKDDAVSVSCNMPANLENTTVSITGKDQFFIPKPKKGNDKGCSNYHTFMLISQANKIMLKSLQASLQQYVNQELPDV